MSEPLRVAMVAEGPTDMVVIEAAISRILDDRPFVPIQLHPEQSLAFGPIGPGWKGVYRWCREAAARGEGSLTGDPLSFAVNDILVLHLDADVAAKTYHSANIQEGSVDLPCAEPCPPPQATTDQLRRVLLRWVGETTTPDRTVLCIPSKSTDAWVVAALFPTDRAVLDGRHECRSHRQQPLRIRIEKNEAAYKRHKATVQEAWPAVTEICSEARRFSEDFCTAVQKVDAIADATDSS